MQVLISCAKTMAAVETAFRPTVPAFAQQAAEAVRQLAALPAEDLQRMLKVNAKIAAENALRYNHFFDEAQPSCPAAFAYDGIVFKQLQPETLTDAQLTYAQQHLFITSFLYGLLRPLDGIRPYRLEGNVRLPDTEGPTRFDYWKPLLTDHLIQAVQADDGILVNLASSEMKRLFDWKRVCREVQVVTPEFKVMQEGQWRTIVVYAKMLRGQMTRFLMEHQPADLTALQTFEPDIPGVAAVMELQ